MTSSQFFKPYRPRAIAAVNGAGRLLDKVGIRSRFNEKSLITAARRKTGLYDFGDESFRTGLRVLIESLEHEARLHPFGRWIMRQRLVDALAVRLRMQDYLKRYPEIAEESISAPLVIVGLQRTGTTMLHRLLAADPDNRALLSWEAINPVPDPRQKPHETDRRIRAARQAEKGLRYLAPDFFAIHPVEANAPEEDVLLKEFTFTSAVPEAMARVPSYADWQVRQDATPVYEYVKSLLQLLQWQRPGKRWVLKTPDHLGYLDVLLQVFPDAKIIHTFRDPVRTAGSYSSMLAHGYGVFSDEVDSEEVADHWHRKNAAAVNTTMQVREQHPESFIDVSYYDLIKEPMAQIRRIYEFAGIELTDDAVAAMEASRKTNKKDKHGVHQYQLEDFGLTAEKVRQDYAAYCEYFGIPNEAST